MMALTTAMSDHRGVVTWRVVIAAAVLVGLSSAPARGQATVPPPLTSNRPGIGDSEALVGRAVVQNVLFLITSDSSGRYWNNVVTTSVGRPLSSSISAFTELATGLAEPRAWTLDGGIAWVPRENLQWDLSAGLLVRGPGQNWFLSGGVTLRRLPRQMRKPTPRGSWAK